MRLLAGQGGIIGALLCTSALYCIQGTPPYPVSCRTLQCFASQPSMLIILTRTQLVLLSISSLLGAFSCACHRGWSPLPSPLPSLLPKLPTLMPNPQPRVRPDLLPRWQPSLLLESPFLWPLLSMCSSSESSNAARKSGTQSLFLSRADYTSQQAVAGSFCGSCALVSA